MGLRALFFSAFFFALAASAASPTVAYASNGEGGDFFGSAVAISSDGLLMVAGASHEDSISETNETSNEAVDSGAVYIFRREDEQNEWAQRQYLKSPDPRSKAFFGSSLSLSASGDVLAVGEYLGGAGGLLHVYHLRAGIFEISETLEASNADGGDQFGSPVSVSPNGFLIAVGASQEDSGLSRPIGTLGSVDNSLRNAGAVYVFQRDQTPAAKYREVAYLKPRRPMSNASFGYAVSIADDGTVAVGAPFEATGMQGVTDGPIDQNAPGSGAVYLFESNGTHWEEYRFYFKGTNADAGDHFGISVALAGDVLVVGADGEDSATQTLSMPVDNNAHESGAAYVFVRVSGDWSAMAYIKARNPSEGAAFGRTVALSYDGRALLVGAPLQARNGTTLWGVGAAYLFRSAVGAGRTWTQVEVFEADRAVSGAKLGTSITMTGDGRHVACGTPQDLSKGGEVNSGTVRTFFLSSVSTTSTTVSTSSSMSTTAAATTMPEVMTAATTTPEVTAAATTTSEITTAAHRSTLPSTSAMTMPPTLPPTSVPTLAPDQIFEGGEIINGSATITSDFQVVDGVLTVNGDLDLQAGSNVTLSDSSIVSTGTVTVSGPLVLQLTDAPMDGDIVQLVSGSSVSGQFSDITLQSANLEPCQKATIEQQNLQGNALSAVISVDSSACNVPSVALIAGVVAGAVILLIVVVSVIGVVVRRRRDEQVMQALDNKLNVIR